MPAIPVAPRSEYHALQVPVPTSQGFFEDGDHLYLQTPVQKITPTDAEIEEYAFSSAVKAKAPNQNIVWFRGRYVEADRANANGAQWSANELAIKSLTPMLMPVTVMHDPSTAVGTIADVKHLTPQRDGIARPRIDTVLALWGHRFPEAVAEAERNAEAGTLMQSMECYSPWYECSVCHSVFHKLPGGAEQAMWCEHLAASRPSGGYGDFIPLSPSQDSNASRILGDVCFTGTGLIFGSRGARGAYTEAHLEDWARTVTAFHVAAHTATSTPRSEASMGLVQIEQSELDLLRKERDDARSETAQEKARATAAEAKVTETETKVEAAEAAKVAAEEKASAAETKVTELEETANRASLKDQRWGALGSAFTAKLGDFTKSRLQEQASTLSDEEWDNRLKELEETTAVKRDAKADEGGDPSADELARRAAANGEHTFSLEEIASAGSSVAGGSGDPAPNQQTPEGRRQVIGALAGAFDGKS
jgi:hypothetical protein